MIRGFLISLLTIVCVVLGAAGFRGTKFTRPPLQFVPDMKDQPKVITQHKSGLYKDGGADKPVVRGTVPFGYSSGGIFQTGADAISPDSHFTSDFDYYNTGSVGGMYGAGFPVAVNDLLLSRGAERYSIHCAVCHDKSGSGNGIAKKMGLVTIASLLDDRIKSQPEGQLFSTITHGKNTMGAYGPQISSDDRWAIVAHLRVLQSAHGAKISDLPDAIKKKVLK
jgi:mono/diheme cytochrome c family protein